MEYRERDDPPTADGREEMDSKVSGFFEMFHFKGVSEAT